MRLKDLQTNHMSYEAKIFVSLKSSVSDPQGLAIEGSLNQLGFSSVANVRAGKFITLTIRDFSVPLLHNHVYVCVCVYVRVCMCMLR